MSVIKPHEAFDVGWGDPDLNEETKALDKALRDARARRAEGAEHETRAAMSAAFEHRRPRDLHPQPLMEKPRRRINLSAFVLDVEPPAGWIMLLIVGAFCLVILGFAVAGIIRVLS